MDPRVINARGGKNEVDLSETVGDSVRPELKDEGEDGQSMDGETEDGCYARGVGEGSEETSGAAEGCGVFSGGMQREVEDEVM